MKQLIRLTLPVLLLVVPVVGATPDLPETPFAPVEILHARPFTLAEPMEYRWSQERPLVSEGWILVLEVDPAVAWPRQSAVPILYAGDQVARYALKGYPSGRVVVLVPARIDLHESPVWFGSPMLPEQVDRSVIESEQVLARQAGIGPLPAAAVDAALSAGGGELVLQSSLDLETVARDLHGRYVGDLGLDLPDQK